MRSLSAVVLAGALLFMIPVMIPAAAAEDFYCEVMAVEGTVTLTNSSESARALAEGDLLTVDDLVEVGVSSYVDLAYDREWNNVTRVEESSSVRIRSLQPVELGLEAGGVFAKLKSLPRESSFDVRTPTAIASVRGTEYRTTYTGGETQIENVSDSDVFVYGLDDLGQRQTEVVVVRRAEATQVVRRGQPPAPPRAMQDHELRRAAQFGEHIDRRVQQNLRDGRFGKMREPDAPQRFREQRQSPPGKAGGEPGRRPGQPETLSGEQARQKAGNVFRSDGPPGGSADGPSRSEENRPLVSGAGLGEPYFPGGEEKRSGGPNPVGLPTERWDSGGTVERSNPEGRPERGQMRGPAQDGKQEQPGGLQKQPGQRPSEPRPQAQQNPPRKDPQQQQQGKAQAKPAAPRPRQQR